jgi:hypothetical protein
MPDKIKRFYCRSKDLCFFRNEWANNGRCFAPYITRSSCPNIMRKDGKSAREGSNQIEEYFREGDK